MKTLQEKIKKLGIEPLTQEGVVRLSQVSPRVVFHIAQGARRLKHQLWAYLVTDSDNFNDWRWNHSTVYCLAFNPHLKKKAAYRMITDGHWKAFPRLLWQPLFDVNEFVKTSPEIRGEIDPRLAIRLFDLPDLEPQTVFEFWSVAVMGKSPYLKMLCVNHPNASPDMLEAYILGCTIQEIELRREGLDEDHIMGIKDFLWY